MDAFVCELGDRKLSVSAWAEDVVRVRISRDLEPTLFERYGIFTKPDERQGRQRAVQSRPAA